MNPFKFKADCLALLSFKCFLPGFSFVPQDFAGERLLISCPPLLNAAFFEKFEEASKKNRVNPNYNLSIYTTQVAGYYSLPINFTYHRSWLKKAEIRSGFAPLAMVVVYLFPI